MGKWEECRWGGGGEEGRHLSRNQDRREDKGEGEGMFVLEDKGLPLDRKETVIAYRNMAYKDKWKPLF